MASSGKFDLSSGSPDRPLYTSGQRTSYIAASSMDRSSSFRENIENPILSSLPSMSRTTSSVTQGDVTNFLQCLRFDPKSMAAEYKFNRHGDFKRLASAALGAHDDSSLKGKIPSSSTSFSPEDIKRLRAGLRESSIKARERVKIFSETLSVANKCFPSIPSRKRSRPDTNGSLADRGAGKMSTQNHVATSVFDFDQPKVEERVKNTVPNKRTRTSMVDQRGDVRPNTPARSSVSMDRDKEVTRPLNSNGVQNEDRADGWEKAKMKKKRSVIKPDAASSPSSTSTKPIDGYREPKQGIQHARHLPDSRSRLTDPYGFRPGAANGVVGVGKSDGTSPQGSIGGRPSIPKPDQESSSLLYDKRDRINNNPDKERSNIRAVNKAGVREEFVSGSPTSTKLQATARGPRSASGVVPKASSVVQRATASNDWEPPHNNTAKPPGVRKRTLSSRSSSPPVTQWADRRPQKISRTARRTNLNPVLSNNDEITPSNSSDVTAIENGRRFAVNNSPRQSKSNTLSESEESGAVEYRSRDKGKKCHDLEVNKGGQNVQKLSNLVLPVRKNKMVNGVDHVDGVRRQGRTGRGFASARFAAPITVEKHGNVKQLRTAKLSFDKSESKLGRPPTRKLQDRRAYTRQKQTVAPDFQVGSDNGHEELLAPESAIYNPSHALSGPFWKQIEPLFGFLSDMDISFLKQQANIDVIKPPKNVTENRNSEPRTPTTGDIPLCQRLLSALITEDDNEDLKFNNYGSSTFELEADLGSKIFNHGSLQHDGFNGYGLSSTTLRSCNDLVHTLSDNHNIMSIPDSEITNMSLNERILLEIQSIGLYPELVPDLAQTGDDDINGDISDLEKKHHEQVFRKKNLLDKLLKSTSEAKALQEKEFQQHSLDKLTGMAYHKYMSCCGPNASKNASGKLAKQAALSFVKRTLDQCQEFETTGKSCFTEPLFKEMFVSGSSQFNDAQLASGAGVESGQLYGNSIERVSGTQLSPSFTHSYEQTHNKDETSSWSTKVKKREFYLDNVVSPTPTGTLISNGTKGKRTERDTDFKLGRPTPTNSKNKTQTKTKIKQKTTQLSASINNTPTPVTPKVSEVNTTNETNEFNSLETEEPLDFSHLQLPEMDVLGVGDDFGEQGQDIGSWLNIDDEILQDEDFMGLEIPMDDLTDLNMMV